MSQFFSKILFHLIVLFSFISFFSFHVIEAMKLDDDEEPLKSTIKWSDLSTEAKYTYIQYLASDEIVCPPLVEKLISVGSVVNDNMLDFVGVNPVMEFFKKLNSHSNIRVVHLWSKNVGECALQFAQFLPDTKLELLSLKNCNLNDKGLIKIGENIPQTLKTLDVSYNPITDDGANGLAKALNDKNVETIFIDTHNISDEGILEFAKNLKGKMSEVWCIETKRTKTIQDQIRADNPNIKWVFEWF